MKKLLTMMVMMVLVLAGCSSTGESEELTSIKVATMKDVTYAPFLYAVEEGMYEEAGLDVEITFFDSAKDRNAAWDSGEYDMETADLTAGALLGSLGDDIKITGAPRGAYKLVASPEVSSKFDGDFSTLDGMSVGYSENTVIEFYVDYLADREGIKFDKTAIPSIPDRYSALLTGEIDLAILPDPFPTMAVEEGADLIWQSSEEGVTDLSGLNWKGDVSTDTIDTFVKVSNDAADIANEQGPDSYKEYAISYGLVEEQYFDAITDGLEFTQIEAPTKETWDEVETWALNKGMIENLVDYDQIVYQG